MVAHPVRLRGISIAGTSRPPILERTDQEFIPALLGELARPRGVEHVTRPEGLVRDRDRDGVPKLYQPVHRTFHVALFEVVCETFGEPRLDPARIDSAGLVLRRCGRDQAGRIVTDAREGWREDGQRLRGWVSFNGEAEANQDPDAERRRPELSLGHPELDRRLALRRAAPEVLSESVAPLFIAPPEVCRAAQRTLLYGLVPVTSPEQSETPDVRTLGLEDAREHVPVYLRAGSDRRLLPRRNQQLASYDADDRSTSGFQDYLLMLRQLIFEFDIFNAEDPALFNLLQPIRLPFDDRSTIAATDHVREAAEVLIYRNPEARVRMPEAWPALSEAQATAIAAAVKRVVDRRLATVTPREGRFDELDRQYQIRAFVRVRSDEPGCPPDLAWSDYSERFTIAPWHDSNPRVSPVKVILPDLLGQNALRNLKPNVSFVVPKDLFDFLQHNSARDLMEGKGRMGNGAGIAFDWICSFNIPIITLCAFIVLNIFLQLFDLIFRWLLFIKICLPFPRR